MGNRFDLALGKTIPIQVEFPGNLRDFVAVCIVDKILEKKRHGSIALAMKEAYLQAENFLDARGMSREELQKSINDEIQRAPRRLYEARPEDNVAVPEEAPVMQERIEEDRGGLIAATPYQTDQKQVEKTEEKYPDIETKREG